MATFDYRRKLTPEERMQVAGAGLGAGLGVALVVAYFARILLQRTRLRDGGPPGSLPRP